MTAALALVGCGGRSPSDAVRVTLTRFGQATDRHDYATLCRDIFTPELVQGLLDRGLPCERALQIGLADVTGARLQVQRVAVHGDHADAIVRSTATGEASTNDTVELVREAGSWRIARLVPTTPSTIGAPPSGPTGPTALSGSRPTGPSGSSLPAGSVRPTGSAGPSGPSVPAGPAPGSNSRSRGWAVLISAAAGRTSIRSGGSADRVRTAIARGALPKRPA